MRKIALPILTIVIALSMGNSSSLYGVKKKKPIKISQEVATERLFNAVESEVPALVRLAIHNKANVNAVKNGKTPLLLACRKVHFEIAKILLQEGANVNAMDSLGKSCLDLVLVKPSLKDIQLADQLLNIANLVIAHGALVTDVTRSRYSSIYSQLPTQLEFLGLFYREPMTFQQQLAKKNDTERQELEKLAQKYGCTEPLVLIQAPNEFKNRLHNLLRTHKQVDIEAI
jgi:hypothetical protein